MALELGTRLQNVGHSVKQNFVVALNLNMSVLNHLSTLGLRLQVFVLSRSLVLEGRLHAADALLMSLHLLFLPLFVQQFVCGWLGPVHFKLN